MAAIKTNYDLALGATRSSSITSPTFIDLQALLGTVEGRVTFYLQRKQSTGDWISVKNEAGKPVAFNTLDAEENGISVQFSGSDAVYSVSIVPGASTTGTLTLDAETDGVIT